MAPLPPSASAPITTGKGSHRGATPGGEQKVKLGIFVLGLMAAISSNAWAENSLCAELGRGRELSQEHTQTQVGAMYRDTLVGVKHSKDKANQTESGDVASKLKAMGDCERCVTVNRCSMSESATEKLCAKACGIVAIPTVGQADVVRASWVPIDPALRTSPSLRPEAGSATPKARSLAQSPVGLRASAKPSILLQNSQGKCLDYRFQSSQLDHQVVAVECGSPQTQTWFFDGVQLRTRQGYCLDATGYAARSGFVLRDCKNVRNVWQHLSTGQLKLGLMCITQAQNSRLILLPCETPGTTTWARLEVAN